MSMDDFQVIRRLGEGAYSSVYLVTRILDKQDYALKKIKLMNLSDREKENALNEIRILASIQHPNIVQYKEAFFDDNINQLCIIMDYAHNGDLYQKILNQQTKNQLFKEDDIWDIFIQIVKALKQLHQLKIFHRDLKSANVFLYNEGLAKLGDMNVSKVAKKGMLLTQTGTPYYASPEVWKEKPYDNKSDIWSLGCVLYEMTTLKPPFRAEDMEGLYKRVCRGYYPKINSHYSQDLNNLIRMLLQVNPQLRPSADKILQLTSVQNRINNNDFSTNEQSNCTLLNTINLPRKINTLQGLMPKSNYKSQSLNAPKTTEVFQSNQQSIQQLQQMIKHEKQKVLPKIANSQQYQQSHLNEISNRKQQLKQLYNRRRKDEQYKSDHNLDHVLRRSSSRNLPPIRLQPNQNQRNKQNKLLL